MLHHLHMLFTYVAEKHYCVEFLLPKLDLESFKPDVEKIAQYFQVRMNSKANRSSTTCDLSMNPPAWKTRILAFATYVNH